ncbi:ribosomal protein S19 family protein [Candidatus Micrarchaeota archaeon]|nr:ribosomal protein S19 family protein [Candidatus Micrarchaeota archaeon]
MARKFYFRGKDIEELKKMSLEEFSKLLSSHERRTLKRMSYRIRKFLEKLRHAAAKGKVLKTHEREMIVIPEMLGMRIRVHQGNGFVDLTILSEMLGRRLGEFAFTTKLVKHSGPGVGATRGSKSVDLK